MRELRGAASLPPPPSLGAIWQPPDQTVVSEVEVGAAGLSASDLKLRAFPLVRGAV